MEERRKRIRWERKTSLPGKIDYERELNPQQLEVVMAGEGPLLVIAGAGSGKTRTVTYRVARLLELGVLPERILLVTFTNKAAREMLSRVEALAGNKARKVWGGTFHHIGNLVLRRYAHLLAYSPNYTIIDREDTKDLLEDSLEEVGINKKEKRFPKGEVLSDILSFSLNSEKDLESVLLERYPFFMELKPEIEKVFHHYRERKKRANLMDFDDLLYLWRNLLLEKPEIRKEYGRRFLHILVDEYQDTNKIQAEIVDLLASYHRNIMVVGDDSQSIYSFRGANFANIIEFPSRYPEAKLYKLEFNYRSTPQILNLANSSIVHNKRRFPKILRAVKKDGRKPALVPLRDVYHQAEFVAEEILTLREEGVSLNEIAVLYRSHYHSLELQVELTRRGIPYVVRSGLRFFERAHIKDVVAWLKILVNPKDELSWKRILKLIPGVGKRTAEKIWQLIYSSPSPLESLKSEKVKVLFFRKVPPGWKDFLSLLEKLRTPELQKFPSQLVELILEEGYLEYLKTSYADWGERMEDIKQLSRFASSYPDLETFLNELSLLGTVESEVVVVGSEEDEEKVILSSVHQAKGLEWRVVFLIWLSEGRFPAAKALKKPAFEEGEEEERRLFYVACTRAKERLYLTYPLLGGNWNFRTYFMKPSCFVRELDPTTYEEWIVEEEIVRLLQESEGSGLHI